MPSRLNQICRLQRLLDPPGSAYRSETGGLMEALRVLTPEQSISVHFIFLVIG